MYKVFFGSTEIARFPSIENALAFALGLHQSSSIPHEIGVFEPEAFEASVVLKKVDDKLD